MTRRKKAAKRAVAKKPAVVVSVWKDDPESKLGLIDRPVPDLSKAPLRYRIKGAAPAPGRYEVGTPQFRYWAGAEPLRRGGDFWAPLLGVKQWQPGPVLPVSLDKGVDLNAYYDRTELAFFHEKVGGKTYYSGESPDVVCHEMGHACLDAHRPQLFDAPFIEAGAFHESFADMSAILSALQLQEVREAVVADVAAYKSCPVSRCAEQLGAAIRLVDRPAVDPDCLRNAYNAFKYVDPQTLPDSAPATALCAEAHSFSRVFTGAFYEILAGMLRVRSKSPKEPDLAAVATDFARLLMDATAAAPVQPNYFAQVASHVIDADTARFAGRYRAVLANVFVKRQIVPKAAVEVLERAPGKASSARYRKAAAPEPPEASVHRVVLDAAEFGLGTEKVLVDAPLERKPVLSVGAGLAHRHGPAEIEHAARRFVKMLVAHDRIDVESGLRHITVTDATPRHVLRKTHVLRPTRQGMKLTRRWFHCRCGLPFRD
ncbi:MAG TPA: hypothetical protein VLT89_01935 [Usitatibacter sp.]|nr:hypothetical protein [Usitatibacter sp.]